MAEKRPHDNEDASDSKHAMPYQKASTVKLKRPRRNIPLPGTSSSPLVDALRLARQIPATPNETPKKLSSLNLLSSGETAQVNSESSGLQPKPLEKLDTVVKDFFRDGPVVASVKFYGLQKCVRAGRTRIQQCHLAPLVMTPLIACSIPWNSCKLAATLVLLLASPPEPTSTFEALKFLSRSLGGLPTMADVLKTPSADLAKRFVQAKKAAIDGKEDKVTVLGVNLVDVEMLKGGEKESRDMNYLSLSHSFVIAIAREGFRIYQSWEEHGYRLDQYVMRGGSRLRSWEDATAFLKMFQKLCRFQETWTGELNVAYEQCFGVDIMLICGRDKLQPPTVRPYRPWVRIFEINDVKTENFEKFTWEGYVQGMEALHSRSQSGFSREWVGRADWT
ncbi:hypothetical protein ABOM_006002 [Aspergillus bombycis]|uniref:Uncharacterized protein n=1 Tax=Aspergillus bombycis TaxID=109264 RepID=A0A1F8A2D7_9EURO|nr:hypothetical protein ABOM_006002 [Aspergillus bombycis]OGM45863.1 hypothetical protein ABOM_006002 [Aspergillus bombycis]